MVNFDLPEVAEDYVHRIGRTGRAGCSGEALSLVSDEDVKKLKAIHRLIKKQIPEKVSESFNFMQKPEPPKSKKQLAKEGENSKAQKSGKPWWNSLVGKEKTR